MYNPGTKKEEPQFKKLEDIPEEFRDQFKETPEGGFVKVDVEDNIEKAQLMVMNAKERIDAYAGHRNKHEKISKGLKGKAEKQEDLAAEIYEAGKEK